MISLVFLADIGSTFIKGLVFDLDGPNVVCSARAPTNPSSGVSAGFHRLRDRLKEDVPVKRFGASFASSSAHGGLKVVALGLMPELTARAARMACLNAGAKLVGCFNHRVTAATLAEIDSRRPDIVLLAGGTDGGDRGCVIHNARQLTELRCRPVVLYAGNCEAAATVRDICSAMDFFVADNVLPELGRLNIEPARDQIRNIFLRRIVAAKGLGEVAASLQTRIIPTPLAVLKAVQLLGGGAGGAGGWGEVAAVDVGGATTDVDSACEGRPLSGNVIVKGGPEPYMKRTVEGDIGMRASLSGLLSLTGARGTEEGEALQKWAETVSGRPSCLPRTDHERECEAKLAARAAVIALERHAGTLTEHYTPAGRMFVQKGKDMREVSHIVATGGVFSSIESAGRTLEDELSNPPSSASLRPRRPVVLVDRQYVLFAAGLLASCDSAAAFSFLTAYLRSHEHQKSASG